MMQPTDIDVVYALHGLANQMVWRRSAARVQYSKFHRRASGSERGQDVQDLGMAQTTIMSMSMSTVVNTLHDCYCYY